MGHRGPGRLSCRSPWGAGPPQAAGDAAPPAGRRSGPKGQAGASAGGLAGAPPSRPRRSGGPYRRHAARRRCAAAAPWERPAWGRSLARIEQNITVLYAGRAMAGRAPAHHPHAFSPPEPGPGSLGNCGVTGLCIRHRPGGVPPQLYKTTCFVQTGPGGASGLPFGGGASPGWRNARPPGAASGASLALGRGTGGSGELIWRTTQPPPPEWRAAPAAHRPAALARAGRRSGPQAQAEARARALGPGRRCGPQGLAGASGPRLPPLGGGGGSPGRYT